MRPGTVLMIAILAVGGAFALSGGALMSAPIAVGVGFGLLGAAMAVGVTAPRETSNYRGRHRPESYRKARRRSVLTAMRADQSPQQEAEGVASCHEPAAAVVADPGENYAAPMPRPVTPRGVEPHDVLDALLRSVGEGYVESAHLWMHDEVTSTLRLIASAGSMHPSPRPVRVSDSTLGKALERDGAVLLAERRVIDSGVEQVLWRYAVPMRSGQTRGVVALDVTGPEVHEALLAAAVAELSVALCATLALHTSRTETDAARDLTAAIRAITRLIDADEIVLVALEHAMKLSSAQTGSIMLLGEDGTLSIAASRGLPADVAESARLRPGEGVAGRVAATGRSLVIEDIDNAQPRHRSHGVRSAVAVPVSDETGVLGVLNVGCRAFRARFTSAHVSALESLGGVLALALRNARAHESERQLYIDTLTALAAALETKDPYSQGTSERVLDLSTRLGQVMGLDEAELEALKMGALLHDLGMAAAGDVATVADRPLSTVEWGMLKMHPVIAADILEQTPALRAAIPIVYHHHEHYDGSGYVLGASGENIPLGARVLAVADAFVAMTSKRPYRPAFSQADALAEIAEKAGSQFDPEVVRALLDLMAEPGRREISL